MKILFQDRITLYFMQHRPCFGLLFVKTGKFSRNYGKYLANLKDDRESGDYEIFSYIDKETARTAVKEAGEFIKGSKAYLKKSGLKV